MSIDLDKGGRIPQTHRTYLGPTKGWVQTDEPSNIEWVLLGGGQDITTGFKGTLLIPEWLIINSWVLTAETPGSIVFDIWKTTQTLYVAGSPPVVGDSVIGGGAKPTLSSQYAAQGTVEDWTTLRIDQNDVLAFVVDSANSIQKVTLTIKCVRTIGQFAGDISR